MKRTQSGSTVFHLKPLLFVSASILRAKKAWREGKTTLHRKRGDRVTKPPKDGGLKASPVIATAKTPEKNYKGVADGKLRSYLLELPLELRLGVYEHVIGPEQVHIMFFSDKIWSFRCRNYHLQSGQYGEGCCWIHDYLSEKKRWVVHKTGMGVLPMLQTCRSIYNEMIEMLYSKPTFRLHDYRSVLAFAGVLLPKHFNSIRSVHFEIDSNEHPWPVRTNLIRCAEYSATRCIVIRNKIIYGNDDLPDLWGAWTMVCRLIGKMEGLRNLKMDLNPAGMWHCWADIVFRMEELDEFVMGPLEVLSRNGYANFRVRFGWLPVEQAAWSEPAWVTVVEPDSEGPEGWAY